jgi:hypothetical protein
MGEERPCIASVIGWKVAAFQQRGDELFLVHAASVSRMQGVGKPTDCIFY